MIMVIKIGKAVIQSVKKRIYDFIHPSVDSLMREFAIVEKPISPEDYEQLEQTYHPNLHFMI